MEIGCSLRKKSLAFICAHAYGCLVAFAELLQPAMSWVPPANHKQQLEAAEMAAAEDGLPALEDALDSSPCMLPLVRRA